MKRALAFVLAFVLAACATPAPAPAPAATLAPPATPAVIIQTVLVTVVATQQTTQQPTEAPTSTAMPTQTPQAILATDTPAASAAAATPAAPAATIAATATLPPDAGGGLFTNMTRSSDHFALKCQPDTITFGVSTDNVYVTGVDLYYRIEDRLSVSISTWQWGGGMVSDKHGNFTVAWSASKVDKDLRSHRAWFDYQFVGLNKQAQAVGRSLRIVKQITYTIDCGD